MDWTKEKLYNLGIFELRSIAREVGVKSPTLLKKYELIESIINITSGETSPYVKLNNKGRPPKEIGGINTLIDVFLPVQKTKTDDVFKDEYKISSGNAEKNVKSSEFNFAGYLDVLEQGYGFLRKTFKQNQIADVFINQQLIYKLNLKTGDYVAALCKQILQTGQSAVIDILEVNNISISDYVKYPRNFSYEIEKPKDVLVENDFARILKGNKVAVCGNKREVQIKLIKLFNETKIKHKILLNIDAHEEDFINEENVINISLNEENAVKISAIKLAIASLLRYAEQGKDVALFITNLTFAPIALSEKDFVNENVELKALTKTKSLFSEGKKIKNAGSLTIFAGLINSAINAKVINSCLEEVSNIVI